jgi:hypothetical protein
MPQTQPVRDDPIPEPCRVAGVLMFALTVQAVDEARAGDEAPGDALTFLHGYVQRNEQSSLRALHPNLLKSTGDGRWQLAIPPRELVGFELARIQVFTPAPGDDAEELQDRLRVDGNYIVYVHRPAIRYPLRAQPPALDPDDPQWALQKCGFHEVWAEMETGHPPKPIAIIDKGDDKGHPEITSVFSLKVPPRIGPASGPNHAAAVAGVVAATRAHQAGRRMAGGCSARLHLYNAWADGAFDPCAYYRALWTVAQAELPVLNLSLGWICEDRTERTHLEECIARGVVVVAAMGNLGEDGPPIYPAAYPQDTKLVAVGGVNGSDSPVLSSSRGSHMWISAPGEDVLTIAGDKRYSTEAGTSFAAAFVSAAVWLARHFRPCLTVDQVREVLRESVAPATIPPNRRKHSPDVGHGRLDMRRMLEVLKRPEYDCPEPPARVDDGVPHSAALGKNPANAGPGTT